MWKGRYRAVVILIIIASAIIDMFIVQTGSLFLGTLVFTLVGSAFLWLADMIKTAVTGKPLFYDVKYFEDKGSE
jgi:predicted membrane protein